VHNSPRERSSTKYFAIFPANDKILAEKSVLQDVSKYLFIIGGGGDVHHTQQR
jgi:hypothetical protein